MVKLIGIFGAVLSLLVAFETPASAEAIKIKIGAFPIIANSGVYIAQERGYFAAEGLKAEIVPIPSPAATVVAVASGDLDFAITGNTAALYTLGGQGAVRIIAGQSREYPGFQNNAYVVSAHAYDNGLKSLKDFAGHSFVTTSIGSPGHYALGLLAEKEGFDLKSVHVIATQSLGNSLSSLVGGRGDCSIMPITAVMPEIQAGKLKLFGWVGDETPWQVGSVLVSKKTADTRGDLVKRFLIAYRKGTRDYHDAFTGPDEKRADQPGSQAILELLSKYLKQPVDRLKLGIPYIDRDGAIDENSILHQIAWYKSQGMMKEDINPTGIVDRRYAIILPGR